LKRDPRGVVRRHLAERAVGERSEMPPARPLEGGSVVCRLKRRNRRVVSRSAALCGVAVTDWSGDFGWFGG